MIYSAQCCAKWISYPCVYLFKVLRMLRIANTLFHSKSQEALELKRWWRGNVVGKNNNKSAIRGHATKDTGPFLVFTMKRDFLLYLKFHQVLNFIFCFLKLKAQIGRMAIGWYGTEQSTISKTSIVSSVSAKNSIHKSH